MNIVDVIRALGGFAWFGAIALFVTAVARASRNQNAKGLSSTAIAVVIVAIILSTLGAGLVYVESNERGVVKTVRAGGVRPVALEPGLHWILPVVEQVVTYSISNQTYTMSATPSEGQIQADDSITARTKDGQVIIIDASVIYRVDPTKVVQLHIIWQNNYQDGIVRPETRGIIRDAVSQYGVEEVVSSKRAEMVQAIADELSSTMSRNNLELVDFVLRDIHFSTEYAAAVETKQIAEQQAQQAQLVVEQRRQEAEQARQVAQGQADAAVIAAQGAADAQIIQAEAQAKANELIGQSIQANPEILQYQYILKLAPGVQTVFIPSGNQFILPLPDTTINTPTTEPVTP
ncbi:MAG TPA: prohibitin family protein [Anaerolineales bacterium]|nr:prohibitin family protein [Anaerolineales bacterium]